MGHCPFDADDMDELFNKIRAGKFLLPSHLSKDVKDLLRRMIEVDTSKRITAQQALDHPWITNQKFASFNTQGSTLEEQALEK